MDFSSDEVTNGAIFYNYKSPPDEKTRKGQPRSKFASMRRFTLILIDRKT